MKKLPLLLLALYAPLAGAAYKCVDERGLTHIGDTPPAGCASVVMYEVTKRGAVIRRIDPTMTDEQAKAKAEADAKRAIADKAAAEQKRKDTALLATYSSDKEFDVVRDRNIEPLTRNIKGAQDRIRDVEKRSKQVDEEMEFYTAGKSKATAKKAEVPVSLASEKERLVKEKKSLVASIASLEKEIEDTRSKFDNDKRRWVALKAGKSDAPADPPVAEAKPETKSSKNTK